MENKIKSESLKRKQSTEVEIQNLPFHGDEKISEPKTKKLKNSSFVLQEVPIENFKIKNEKSNGEYEDAWNAYEWKSFIKSLRSDNAVEVLQQLLVEIKNKDIIAEYLENGGSALRIAEILDRSEDKKNSTLICSVFSALRLVLLKVMSKFPLLENSTEQTCKHLMNSYGTIIKEMLIDSVTFREKKIALSTLAAIATLSVGMANEVLVLFSSLTSKQMDKLAGHSRFSEDKSVRKYFIHLFLAFFSHGKSHLIKMLVTSKGTIGCITRGLLYDDATTVVLVLTALRTNVVESDTVIKTLKIHTFNTQVLLDILSLYKWKGPKLNRNEKKRKFINEFDEEDILSQSIKEDQDSVRNAVHAILLLLLTNHKLGVVFQDPSVGTSGYHCNELVFSVLKAIEKETYWKIKYVRYLASKILQACPDLVSPIMNVMSNLFHPTPSKIWLNTLQFLQEVIHNLNEDFSISPLLNLRQKANIIISVVFSNPVSNLLATDDCLCHHHPMIRFQGISVLYSCFLKISHLYSFMEQSGCTSQELIAFKEMISNFIYKNLNITSLLVKALQSGLDGEIYGISAPAAIDYHMILFDVFLAYFEVNSKTLYNEMDILSALINFNIDSVFSEINEKINLLNVKFIKLQLFLSPIQSPLIESGPKIEMLLNLLGSQPLAKSILKEILTSSYIFSENKEEVDVWMYCLLSEVNNKHVTKLFLYSLEKVIKQSSEILQMITEAKQVASKELGTKQNLKPEIDWDELIQFSVNDKHVNNSAVKLVKIFNVSPLLPAVVMTLEEKPEVSTKEVKKFINNLFIHIFHAQSSIEGFYFLLQHSNVKILRKIKNYISDWTGEWEVGVSNITMFQKFTKIFEQNSVEFNVCNYLYKHENEDLPEMILDADLNFFLLKMVVFHISQLAVKGDADEGILGRGTRLIMHIFRSIMLKTESDLPDVQSVLLHPILIDKFQPLQCKKSNNLTSIVLSLIKLCNGINGKENILAPYRQRMISNIKEALNKSNNDINNVWKSDILMEAFHSLSFPPTEAGLILKTIMETQKKITSPWLDVVSYLLEVISASSISLTQDIIKKLPQYTKLHNSLALYFRRCPHQICLINQELLVKKQNKLSKLTELLLNFEIDGKILLKLIENNRDNPEVVFPAMSAAKACINIPQCNLVKHHIKLIQIALKTKPHPSWLDENSKFIGKLIKEQGDMECHKNMKEFVIKEWKSLPVTETLLNIAEPIFAILDQQAILLSMLVNPLKLLTTPESFQRCETLCTRIKNYVEENKTINWSNLACVEWEEWYRLALKYGEDPDMNAQFLLRTMCALCSHMHTSENSSLNNLLDMVFSHSQFLNAVIWKTQTKYDLLNLIKTLIKLKPSLCLSNHIPVYLSAYNASLSETDQIILQLLQLYEQNGVGLSNWKPYLWGDAAVSYYSLRNKKVPSLLHIAKNKEVFSLFNQKMVNNTISRFPFNRSLEVTLMEESDNSVYDPAFYLPLFTELLASNELIKIRNITENGVLALTICALSSQDRLIRSAAYLVIARFYQHLVSQSVDSLCLQFVEILYKGVCSLNQNVPQLPTITTIFLARTQIVLTDSSHPMYKALGRFIIAKPELNFSFIPEWVRLFRSTEIAHRIYQEWILEVLKDGIRQSKDIGLVISNNIIPLLMDYSSSVLSDKKSKVLILEIILSFFKAAQSSKKNKGISHTLSVQNGLFSWLSHTIYSPKLNSSHLSPLINLLSILNTHVRYPILVINIVLHLLTKSLTKEQYIDLIKVVNSLPVAVLSITVINSLLQFVEENNLSKCTQQCYDILNFGTHYKTIINNEDDITNLLKSIVYKYVKNRIENAKLKGKNNLQIKNKLQKKRTFVKRKLNVV